MEVKDTEEETLPPVEHVESHCYVVEVQLSARPVHASKLMAGDIARGGNGKKRELGRRMYIVRCSVAPVADGVRRMGGGQI